MWAVIYLIDRRFLHDGEFSNLANTKLHTFVGNIYPNVIVVMTVSFGIEDFMVVIRLAMVLTEWLGLGKLDDSYICEGRCITIECSVINRIKEVLDLRAITHSFIKFILKLQVAMTFPTSALEVGIETELPVSVWSIWLFTEHF